MLQIAKKNYISITITIVAVAMAIFHLLTIRYYLLPTTQLLNIHLLLGGTIVLLRKVEDKEASLKLIIPLLLIFMGSLLYIHFSYFDLIGRVGRPLQNDLLIGAVIIITVLIITKMKYGWSIPIVAITFILYTLYGNYMPDILYHSGFSYARVIASLTINLQGIYGSAIRASAELIVMFLVFVAIYDRFGGGDFFFRFAMTFARSLRSGPAQVAVISSGLMGMINGTATANVASTGSITIPLMKKTGYSANFAGAIESAASTGGQIMPPIMGAAAFLMASILGVRYFEIMIAGIIPAIIYFIIVGWQVHLRACSLDLKMFGDDQKVEKPLFVLKQEGYMFLPVVVIVLVMMLGYSAQMAALYAIISIVAIGAIKEIYYAKSRDIHMLKSFAIKLFGGLKDGAVNTAGIAVVTATLGIVIELATLTGLGFRITDALTQLAAHSLFLSVGIGAVICLIFGMGLPTIGAYIVVATLVAPAITALGIPPITSHFLVFYYAIIANITPPVGIAALVATGISGGDFFKTGFYALRLSVSALIIPILAVYNPALLLAGEGIDQFIYPLVTLVALLSFGTLIENYLFIKTIIFEKIIITAGIVILIMAIVNSNISFVIIGLGTIAVFCILQYKRSKRSEQYEGQVSGESLH